MTVSLRHTTFLLFALAALTYDYAVAQVDPRNPDFCELPYVGTMTGIIESRIAGWAETYGQEIYAVGDVDRDGRSDWLIQHLRVDTIVYDRMQDELLLYRGVQGGLPDVSSGQRIGPTRVGSQTQFLAAGDWDNDGNVDLAVREFIFGDTTGGSDGGWDVASVVVYWGSLTGVFDHSDTTHLNSGVEMWLGVRSATAADLDGDLKPDLCILTGGKGFEHSGTTEIPKLLIFRGRSGERWGREGISRASDWHWWNAPDTTKISVLNHDADGANDVAFIRNDDAIMSRASVAVLYGVLGKLPDTNAVETVLLSTADGHYASFIDLTGDRVPELIMTAAVDEVLKVFVGLKGQRLREQYGSGDDPPRPNAKEKWWGKPWAEIALPMKHAASWRKASYHAFYDLGDVGLDSVGDVCIWSHPWIGCYNGGRMLDDFLDGMIYIPGRYRTGVARLGDIDGSGEATIAVGYCETSEGINPFPGAIRFVKTSRCVPVTGQERELPQGTDTVAGSPLPSNARPQNTLSASIFPNPLTRSSTLMWHPRAGSIRIALIDSRGNELRRWYRDAAGGRFAFETAGLPRGAYALSLTIGGSTEIIRIVLQ